MRIFLSILAFFSCAFAEENFTEIPDVCTTEGLPSSLIEGIVCAISGEYTESCIDMTIAGIEPLTIGRNYSNLSNPFWSLNHVNLLLTGYTDNEELMIRARQENGSYIDFAPVGKKSSRYSLRDPKGLTNGSGSGRYYLKNMKASLGHHQKEITVISGAGDKKRYNRFKKDKGFFLIEEFKKANGSCFTYKHDSKILFGLSNIWCGKDGRNFSNVSIKSTWTKHGWSKVSFRGSDGKHLTYHWGSAEIVVEKGTSPMNTVCEDHFHINRVESSFAPSIEYSYQINSQKRLYQVREKCWPEKRMIRIGYYGKKDLKKHAKDFCLDRVKYLKAPVGHSSEPHVTHRFVYHEEHKGIGSTEVFDAYSHRKQFFYDKHHRLTEVHLFSGRKSYKLYSKELFKWGRGSQEGNLLGKALVDDQGVVHHARYFTYDQAGNTLTRQLYGRLTGLPCNPLVLKESLSLVPGNYECELKTYTYSDDGRNLMTSETDSNGVVTLLEYCSGTDHIKAKRVMYENRIHSREFYAYDDNGALCKKVVDDSCGWSEDDLNGVSQRLTTYIANRNEAPVGYPEKIVQTFFNFASGKEELLSVQILHYSPQGHLIAQENYDANNQLGYTLTWEYDSYGNIIREVNALGQSIVRKYDPNNNLIFEQGPSQDFYTKNTYDYSNRLIRKEEFHDNGQRFTSHYKYNRLNQCISNTNAYGQEIKQTYDDFGRVIEEEYPPLVDVSGELKVPVTKTTYNFANQPIVVTDELGRETHTEFNIRGQPIEITYPNGTVEKFVYRLDGQLLSKIDKAGIITTYDRDPLGRILHETVCSQGILLKQKNYTYNSLHLISSIDETGLTTHYYYDFAGRLQEVVKGEQRERLTYDSWGRVCEKKEWFGNKDHEYQLTITEYDKLNRVIEEKVLNEEVILRCHRYAYDERGNKTVVQNGDQITITEYNAQNQPIKITNPAGEHTYTVYNFQFIDTHGRQVLQTITTDPLGYQTIDTYDPANNLVEVQRKTPYGMLIFQQNTYYDLCGNMVRIQNHKIEEGKIIDTIESYFEYTLDDQLSLYVEANGRSEQKITRYHYNSIGQKIEWIKNDGTLFYYTYDTLGRLQSLLSSDGSIHYHYTYDLKDQLIKVEDIINNQITQRTYDSYGNLLVEKLGHGLTLAYTYDLLDRTKSIQLPDETSIEYIYDPCNLKKVQRISEKNYTYQNLEHNLNGKPTQTLLGESVEVNYTYDKAGRCTKIDTPHYKQEIPENGYDPAGNLVLCHTQEETYQYTYDDLYQLIREKDHEYQYDSLNNRIKKDNEIGCYNALHQLIQKGADPLVYDKSGNLIQRIENGEMIQYSYDALDRLISVNKNGQLTTYSYDPFNRRLTRKNDVESKFIYQNQDEIGLWQEESIKELRILDNLNRTLAIELEKAVYIPTQDIAGNIVCIYDFLGDVIEEYQYTSFGEMTILNGRCEVISESVIKNPWQYSNKRRDSESGLIAFGLRYYDAGLARWISPDPAGTIDGPNLYAYVHNNPLTFQDEYGLFGAPPFLPLDYTRKNEPAPYKDPEITYQFMERGFCDQDYYDKSSLGIQDRFIQTQEQTAIYDTNSILATLDPTRLPFQQPPKGLMVGFGNGMGNVFEDFSSSMIYGSTLLNVNIKGVHSASFGFTNDIKRCIAGLYHGVATETVVKIHELWQSYFKENPKGRILWICHSRGAIDACNALIAFDKELRNRITILAVAPAAYTRDHLSDKAVHLVSSRDIVPYFDLNGRASCKHSTKILKPDSEAPWFDHSFTSPTYADEINKQYYKFLERHS